MKKKYVWVCVVKREILATNHKGLTTKQTQKEVGNKQSKKMFGKNKTGKKSALKYQVWFLKWHKDKLEWCHFSLGAIINKIYEIKVQFTQELVSHCQNVINLTLGFGFFWKGNGFVHCIK